MLLCPFAVEAWLADALEGGVDQGIHELSRQRRGMRNRDIMRLSCGWSHVKNMKPRIEQD